MLETDPGLPNSVFRLDRLLAQGNCTYPYSAFTCNNRRVLTPSIVIQTATGSFSAGPQAAGGLQQLAHSSRCRSSEA